METKNVISALVKAQSEIKAPKKSGFNGAYKSAGSPQGSRYSTIDDILLAIRDPLNRNGLTLICTIDRNEFGMWTIARLSHTSGEFIESKFPMLLEKQTNQGYGSARTYTFRYAICNLLSLPSDDDDDGNSADEQAQKKTTPHFKDPVKKNVGKQEIDLYACLEKSEVNEIEKLIGDDEEFADRILNAYSKKYQEPVSTFYDLRKGDYTALLTHIHVMKNPKPIQRQS